MDKIKKVSNPLTIIAIFAGFAEVAATTAIFGMETEVQKIFIWFVMGFPFSLVLLFFGTLWLKREALYAPGDFKDETVFENLLEKNKVGAAKFSHIHRELEALMVPVLKNKTKKDDVTQRNDSSSGNETTHKSSETFSVSDSSHEIYTDYTEPVTGRLAINAPQGADGFPEFIDRIRGLSEEAKAGADYLGDSFGYTRTPRLSKQDKMNAKKYLIHILSNTGETNESELSRMFKLAMPYPINYYNVNYLLNDLAKEGKILKIEDNKELKYKLVSGS